MSPPARAFGSTGGDFDAPRTPAAASQRKPAPAASLKRPAAGGLQLDPDLVASAPSAGCCKAQRLDAPRGSSATAAGSAPKTPGRAAPSHRLSALPLASDRIPPPVDDVLSSESARYHRGKGKPLRPLGRLQPQTLPGAPPSPRSHDDGGARPQRALKALEAPRVPPDPGQRAAGSRKPWVPLRAPSPCLAASGGEPPARLASAVSAASAQALPLAAPAGADPAATAAASSSSSSPFASPRKPRRGPAQPGSLALRAAQVIGRAESSWRMWRSDASRALERSGAWGAAWEEDLRLEVLGVEWRAANGRTVITRCRLCAPPGSGSASASAEGPEAAEDEAGLVAFSLQLAPTHPVAYLEKGAPRTQPAGDGGPRPVVVTEPGEMRRLLVPGALVWAEQPWSVVALRSAGESGDRKALVVPRFGCWRGFERLPSARVP